MARRSKGKRGGRESRDRGPGVYRYWRRPGRARVDRWGRWLQYVAVALMVALAATLVIVVVASYVSR